MLVLTAADMLAVRYPDECRIHIQRSLCPARPRDWRAGAQVWREDLERWIDAHAEDYADAFPREIANLRLARSVRVRNDKRALVARLVRAWSTVNAIGAQGGARKKYVERRCAECKARVYEKSRLCRRCAAVKRWRDARYAARVLGRD